MDSLKSDVLGSRASTVNRWSDTRTSTSLGPLTQEVRVETKPHKKARTHPETMSSHISLRSDVFTLMRVLTGQKNTVTIDQPSGVTSMRSGIT